MLQHWLEVRRPGETHLPAVSVELQPVPHIQEKSPLPPDRVREQIQNLGDEQFLPEYEELIRQYYDQLSERGRKGARNTNPH